ncbi:hypothetical protein TNCT_253371 [Trichonephila clavata]|uniref:Uncharacterized protein n=1 Tax=Trichonephila clavata TaxID=2740835 RepID=A0A8X6HM27_TRICU|nr:hypothetical protein TNCT_253371 [Trichonephila clavata]
MLIAAVRCSGELPSPLIKFCPLLLEPAALGPRLQSREERAVFQGLWASRTQSRLQGPRSKSSSPFIVKIYSSFHGRSNTSP